MISVANLDAVYFSEAEDEADADDPSAAVGLSELTSSAAEQFDCGRSSVESKRGGASSHHLRCHLRLLSLTHRLVVLKALEVHWDNEDLLEVNHRHFSPTSFYFPINFTSDSRLCDCWLGVAVICWLLIQNQQGERQEVRGWRHHLVRMSHVCFDLLNLSIVAQQM